MRSAAWLSTCRAALSAAGLGPDAGARLEVFGSHKAVDHRAQAWTAWLDQPTESFDLLEARATAARTRVMSEMLARLVPGISRAKARGYVRRFDALLAGLASLGSIEARTARVAALARMTEILLESHRRSARVRDLIDFFYCQGSVLHHRQLRVPDLADRLAGIDWRRFAPGMEHACIEGPTRQGPAHINLVRVRGARLDAVHVGAKGPGLAQLAHRRGARVALSGGFTLCSKMDIEAPSGLADPVGLLVDDGQVISPPAYRRTSLVQRELGGPITIERIGPAGLDVELGEDTFEVIACNDPDLLGRGAVAFNRVWGPRCPEHAGSSLVLLGREVLRVERGAAAIPKAGLVVCLPWGGATAELDGACVEYTLNGRMHAAMAAGPALIVARRPALAPLVDEDFVPAVPPHSFAADETRGQNLLPRMVAGLRADGSLILAAIDGRDFAGAIGMTLAQTAELLAALGCVDGINLDGGDSKRLWVDGTSVDRPGQQLEWDRSDPPPGAGPRAEPIRPVYSALLLTPSG